MQIVLENQETVLVMAPSEHPDYSCHQYGVVYVFQDGSDMWSAEPMSASELQCHKAMVDAMSEMPEYDDEDQEEYYTLVAPRLSCAA